MLNLDTLIARYKRDRMQHALHLAHSYGAWSAHTQTAHVEPSPSMTWNSVRPAAKPSQDLEVFGHVRRMA